MFPRTVKRLVWDHQPIFVREVDEGVFIGVVLYCVAEDAPDFEVGLRNCQGWKETAHKVTDKPLFKDAARLLGDSIKELEREPATAKT